MFISSKEISPSVSSSNIYFQISEINYMIYSIIYYKINNELNSSVQNIILKMTTVFLFKKMVSIDTVKFLWSIDAPFPVY